MLILRLREDERQRLGDRLLAARFHDALLWSGSIPLSFHRRLLAGEGGGPFRPGARRADAGHPQHRPDQAVGRGWSGGRAPRRVPGAPTDRPDRIARVARRSGGAASSTSWTSTAREPGSPQALGSIAEVSRAVAVPLQVAGGVDGPEQIELCFAAGATRVVVPLWAVVEDPDRLAACLAIAGDWLGIGLDARPERLREYPWKRYIPPTTLEQVVVGARRRQVSAGSCCRTAARRPTVASLGRLHALDVEVVVAGGVIRHGDGRSTGATVGVDAVIVGEALFTGAVSLDGPLTERARSEA